MRQRNEISLAESGVMAAISVIIALLGGYVPLLYLFWPVPFIMLGSRHGRKWSGLAIAAAGFMIAVLLQPLLAVILTGAFGFMGITLGQALRAQVGRVGTILRGAAASLVSKIAVLGIPWAVVEFSSSSFGINGGLGTVVDEAFALHYGGAFSQGTRMGMWLSAGLILLSVADTGLNYVVSMALLRKLGREHKIDLTRESPKGYN